MYFVANNHNKSFVEFKKKNRSVVKSAETNLTWKCFSSSFSLPGSLFFPGYRRLCMLWKTFDQQHIIYILFFFNGFCIQWVKHKSVCVCYTKYKRFKSIPLCHIMLIFHANKCINVWLHINIKSCMLRRAYKQCRIDNKIKFQNIYKNIYTALLFVMAKKPNLLDLKFIWCIPTL